MRRQRARPPSSGGHGRQEEVVPLPGGLTGKVCRSRDPGLWSWVVLAPWPGGSSEVKASGQAGGHRQALDKVTRWPR